MLSVVQTWSLTLRKLFTIAIRKKEISKNRNYPKMKGKAVPVTGCGGP
jgi:hypothetical protein